jgi:hypothetical protein
VPCHFGNDALNVTSARGICVYQNALKARAKKINGLYGFDDGVIKIVKNNEYGAPLARQINKLAPRVLNLVSYQIGKMFLTVG